MARKLTYEEVKYYIEFESGSGCKLLSEEYVNIKDKLLLKCECGNEFEVSFEKLKSRNKHKCNLCMRKIATNKLRKTNEQFIQEAYDLVGDEYTFLEEYINNYTIIKITHNKCGHIFKVSPNAFLGNKNNSGTRCPKCFGKLKKTDDQFRDEVFALYQGEYEVLGNYTGNKNKIKVKHSDCDFEWEVAPNNLLNGHGCPKCAGLLKKTTNDIKKEIFDLYGDEYTLLSEYKNNKSKISVRHNKCNHVWEVIPNNFIRGTSCPKCYGNTKKTQEIFEKEVYDLVGNEYVVLGNYNNAQTKIEMKHVVCGHKWLTEPANFLSGKRCPNCFGTYKKSTEQFKQEVYESSNGEYEVIGEYVGANYKISMKHVKCGHIWDVRPSNFLNNNSRCPVCNESKGEKRVRKWLEENNINFTAQKEFDGLIGINNGNLSYDFYLPELNLLIEYQGEFHDGSDGEYTQINLERQIEHDKRKRDYAKQNNIRLLEIWYYEFDRIEEILESDLNIGE